MFALCFTIGLPHGLRTFPNCRVKLCSHSLRAILLQMPSPWGFNSHFLVFLKSNCVDGMTFYFLFFIFFHNRIPFTYYPHYKTIYKAWYTFPTYVHVFVVFGSNSLFSLFVYLCTYAFTWALHCCTPRMIIKWSIDENKYSILTYYK